MALVFIFISPRIQFSALRAAKIQAPAIISRPVNLHNYFLQPFFFYMNFWATAKLNFKSYIIKLNIELCAHTITTNIVGSSSPDLIKNCLCAALSNLCGTAQKSIPYVTAPATFLWNLQAEPPCSHGLICWTSKAAWLGKSFALLAESPTRNGASAFLTRKNHDPHAKQQIFQLSAHYEAKQLWRELFQLFESEIKLIVP